MEKSSFFNSINGDRKYKAEEFARYFASFIGNGIFPNPSTNCQVLSNNDMTVRISAGKAWINGYYYENTGNMNHVLEPADSVLDRIDRVVLRWDKVGREIFLYIKVGEYSSNPKPKALQRNVDAYELCLADVRVSAGATTITQASITDTRLDSDLCGVVHGVVEQVDATAIFNQFQDWYTTIKDEYDTDIATWTEEKKQAFDDWYETNTTAFIEQFESWYNNNTTQWTNDFNTWFETIKGQLDGDIAANLQNQINEMKNRNLQIIEENTNTPSLENVEDGALAVEIGGNTLYKRADGTHTDEFEEGCTLESVGELEGNKIEVLSQIGGRNLLENSKGDFVLEPLLEPHGDYNCYKFKCDMKLGEQYTISCDVQITHGEFNEVTVYPYPEGIKGDVVISERGRVIYTFTKTVDSVNSVLIYAGILGKARGNGIIIRNVKIEKGNKATDWTPAPEDITNPEDYAKYNMDKINILLNEPLRGLPNGTRDVIGTDGVITRKIGKRAYQSGDETNINVITDMTDTYYELETPIQEAGDPIILQSFKNGSLFINTTIPPFLRIEYPMSTHGGIHSIANRITSLKNYANEEKQKNQDNADNISKVEQDLVSHLAENVTAHNVSRGTSSFKGNNQEVTIPHGLKVTPTSAYAFPITNPNGYLGEVWIRMDATNLYIGNSGSFTGAMTWTAIG